MHRLRQIRAQAQPFGLSLSPLVSRVGEANSSLSELTTLTGFLGKQQSDGHILLYLDLSFSNYCKILVSDVVSTAPVDASDPNSPSIVWVKSSAAIELVKVMRAQGGADYVRGRIQRSHLRAASKPDPIVMDNSTWTCPRETLDNCGHGRYVVRSDSDVPDLNLGLPYLGFWDTAEHRVRRRTTYCRRSCQHK